MKKTLTIGEPCLHSVKKALLIMKLTLLFLTVAILHASAHVTAQARVTLKSQQTEIAGVLTSIEKQTSYRFLYNNALTAIRQKIDVDLKDLPIQEALGKVFAGTDLTFKMLENNLIVIVANGQAPQDVQVTGKVTGASGETLTGVSVTVKGSTRGTATDSSGSFSLSVPTDAILVFTYVGFVTQEIKVNSRSEVNIQLKPSGSQMNEVVVVGYGTQKKVDVTGSVAHVAGAEIAKQPVLTATQAIQGKVAGVQVVSSGEPGSMPQVIIRGAGSILGGVNPLYIVDGIWTDDITNINSADILAVDVLKDASSCSIYGVRGANGVVLITTRQGSGKMKVNYSNNIGIQRAAYVLPMADAAQYRTYLQATIGLPTAATPYNTNWYNQVLRNAFYDNHNLSVSGSTAQDKYALSVGYLDNNGIIIDNSYKRYTIRFNNEYTPASFIRIGSTASFANQSTQNVPTGTITEDAYRAAPLVPAMVNGKFGNTSQYQNVGNPILDAQNTNDLSHKNTLQGNAFIEVKPIPSFSIKTEFNDELIFTDERAYTYLHPNDTTFFTTNGGTQGASRSALSVNSGRSYHWVWTNTLNFNKTFGMHKLGILAGTEAQKVYSTSLSGAVFNVPAAQSEWYLQDGDASTATNGSSISEYTTNSYLGRIIYSFDDRILFTGNFRADGSSVFAPGHQWGYFPGASVGWILTRENFMRSQDIFQYLKLRASWGELGNSAITPDAPVEATIGNIPYFFNSGSRGAGSIVGGIIPQIKYSAVHWEVTKEADFGFEYSVLKDHLTGEFDIYDKRVNDALINVQVPGTFGSQANPFSPTTPGDVLYNAATIDNKGIEFSARWHDNISSKLSYYIGGNISINRNRVVNLNGGLPIFDGNINGYFTTETKAGYPIGSYFMRKSIGVFQTQDQINNYKDKNGNVLQPGANPGDLMYQFNSNGQLDTAFLGAYAPKIYAGLSAGVTYKSFDLSLDLYGNFGNQVYNGKLQARVVYTDNIEKSVATSYWTPTNHSNTQPSANAGNQPASSYFLASGEFIRINNITLGYNMPASLLKGQRVISSLRVFINAQNPVTQKKYGGFSSELPGSSPTNAGIDLNTYPTTRTFAAGLNVGI
jgi:TonB-dependent starch-binding outer membrane protein SusC